MRYVLRIARNLLIDRRRRAGREARIFEYGEGAGIHASDALDPERILSGKQSLEGIMAAIEALPPRCREAFMLHRFDNLSYPAIGRPHGHQRQHGRKAYRRGDGPPVAFAQNADRPIGGPAMSSTEEAPTWFARVRRGVMSLSERRAYEHWLTDRANRAALAEMEKVWSLLDGGARPAGPRLSRTVMIAALCTSLALVLLSFISNSGFWTSLDWANR